MWERPGWAAVHLVPLTHKGPLGPRTTVREAAEAAARLADDDDGGGGESADFRHPLPPARLLELRGYCLLSAVVSLPFYLSLVHCVGWGGGGGGRRQE